MIPYVPQLTAGECGLACLAMVLRYHGRATSLPELRQVAGEHHAGVSARRLAEVAGRFGLAARGLSLAPAAVDRLRPGSVLHWTRNHFVVFEGVRRGAVRIVDPAGGRRVLDRESFAAGFSGIALELVPTGAFERKAPERPPWTRLAAPVLDRLPLFLVLCGLSLVLVGLALGLPVLTGIVVDRVVPDSDRWLLELAGLAIALTIGLHFAVSLVRARLLLRFRTEIDAELTTRFVERLVRLPYAFFLGRTTGDLVQRLNSNAEVREILASGALSALLDGSLVALYLAILAWRCPEMAALALALAGSYLAVFAAIRQRRKELMSRYLYATAAANGFQVGMLGAMESIKASGAEDAAVAHWSRRYREVLDRTVAQGRFDAVVASLSSALRVGSPLILLGFGAARVLAGRMTLGTMLGLTALAGGFLEPVANLVATLMRFPILASYLERLDDVLLAPIEQAPSAETPRLRGGVRLCGVSFGPDPHHPIVRDVTLAVEPGELVAIVGASGAGKSTLARLIAGLYVPTDGRVEVDGVDLRTLDLAAVRRQMGVVTQHAALLELTVRENLSMPDPPLPQEVLDRAAEEAAVLDEIRALPMGFDTVLHEGGATLSGGQRQRLTLARALAHDPRVLVLDEATSALDAEAERRILDRLEERDCTRIVVAHRLSTVVRADRIVVLDRGQVVEVGTHAELSARGGVYAALISAQTCQEHDFPELRGLHARRR